MRKFIGGIKCSTGDPKNFEFEMPDDASEEEIEHEALEVAWNTIDMWYEEVKIDED